MLAILTAGPVLAELASIRGLIRNGRFAEAIAQCDREIQAAPRSFALHTMKGLALHASGDKASALSAFRQALAINPAYEPALQAAAQIEFESRDPGAIKTVEALLRLDPSSETAHAMLASLLFDRRSCGAAVPHFEKVPTALQGPSMKWQYGVCLMVAQRWKDASVQFDSLLQLREHAPTRYNLALAQWNAKDYPAAVSTLTRMDAPGADADAMRLLASAHEALGDTPKAFSVLQRAIQQNPRHEQLLIDLTILCMDHKALEIGLEVLRAGIQANPASARLPILLGVLLVRNGDMAKGQKAFQEAQQLSPESGLGRIGLASTLMQMGLAADAARVLREQLAGGGPDAKTELTLARALLLKDSSQEEKHEAAALLQRVLKEEPANAAAHGLLGKMYMQLGDTHNATTELAAAVRLDPADRASTYGLMTIYKQAGRTKEAAGLATRIRSLLDKEKADEDAGNRFRVVREDAPSVLH
jgi:tetratricopeptide (TPR) repeat protein